MLRACLLPFLLFVAQSASALEIKSCEDAHIGLTELIAPVGSNSRTYKEDKIIIYVVDTVEPACCAAGIAVVMPDVEDELGGNKCLAVLGFASVQLDEAVAEDDPAKGLLVTIPTRVFNEAADSAPGQPMKLRFDVDNGTMVSE